MEKMINQMKEDRQKLLDENSRLQKINSKLQETKGPWCLRELQTDVVQVYRLPSMQEDKQAVRFPAQARSRDLQSKFTSIFVCT